MKLRALVVGMGLLCTFSSFAATELRYGLEAEYPPFESRNAAGELEGFQQCFLTGTAAEVTPVGQIGDYTFEVGALTQQIASDYEKLVRA